MEKFLVTLSGRKIPRLGLGVWKLSSEDCYHAVSHALKCGYRLIDTARIYGNEEAVGKAIRDSGIPREEIFVTTKLWNSDQTNCRKAFENSLRKLNLDYIDLYLMHYPVPQTRMKAYAEMEKIQEEGLAREIGVSNFMIHHLKELLAKCKIPPAVNQVEMHPWLYQKELAEFCHKQKILLQAYSPLAHAQKWDDQRLLEVAQNLGKTPAQVLIRWSLQKGFIPLPKSGKKERIIENFAVWDFEIPENFVQILDSLNENFHTCWDPTHEP